MKIYPSNHTIRTVSTVNTDEDLVLGYLDSEFIENTIRINVNDNLTTSETKELLPYSIVDSLNITLFDVNNNPLSKIEQEKLLIRQEDDKYLYFPTVSTVFEPETFSYKVLAKKNMKYLTSRTYNISTACSENDLSQKLIQFFSDSYERKLCPSNLRFNSGDIKLESLFNSSMHDTDFLFINASDGQTYNQTSTKINIDELLNSNVVPWIICSEIPGMDAPDYNTQEQKTFNIKNNEVTYSSDYTTKYYFPKPPTEDNVIYHNVFKYHEVSPIIIKEYVNKGFVVYCNEEFMTRLNSLSNMFYEILMYVYLRTYISTQTITEWIADVMPDYIVQNRRLTKKEKFTSHMELHKLLGLREGDATPIEVKIDSKVVYYTGMSSNYLVFRKNITEQSADPIKQSNQISIFTERKNIMFYDQFIYTINEDITDKIYCSINSDILTVVIQPFKNTFLNTGAFLVPVTKQITLNPSYDQQEVYLYWSPTTALISLTNTIVENAVLLASIEVTKEKKDSKLYDMRTRGGGIPESAPDIFDCLDIGHILGRPYRKGGSLITTVTLDIKYEAYKDQIYDIIYQTLKQYMIADDYLVLNLEFK